jgi:hypothetical protein
VVEVIAIGGGLPDLWEPLAPGVDPVVSVSMPVLPRGAKKLRVDTASGGSLKATDMGTVLVEFLADCQVLTKLHLLRFFTPRKSSSWAIDSDEVLFNESLCFAYALTAFSSITVTVYMP